MVLEVLWHFLASVQTSLELSMSNVASHDDGTLQINTGANWILAQLSTYCVNTLVEVDFNTLCTLAWLAKLFRNQLCWVLIHLLQPDTVLVDFSLDVAVGRAAYTHTDRTAGTMTWEANYADVVSQVLATKLCTQADFVSLFKEFVLQVNITESTTMFDWFIVSGPAKGIAFRYFVSPESSTLRKVITISCCMVVPMVFVMSLYGGLEACVKSGAWSQLLIIWLTNIPKNIIMALPFQLIVAGPLVRRVFRTAFPEGTVLQEPVM